MLSDIVTHLQFRICGIENLVNAFRKGKKKEKPVSYKTKKTEVIWSRNAHNSENSAKVCENSNEMTKGGLEKR